MPLPSEEVLDREWKKVADYRGKTYKEATDLAPQMFRLLYEHLSDLDGTSEFSCFEEAAIAIMTMRGQGYGVVPKSFFEERIVPLWTKLKEAVAKERTRQQDTWRETAWYTEKDNED